MVCSYQYFRYIIILNTQQKILYSFLSKIKNGKNLCWTLSIASTLVLSSSKYMNEIRKSAKDQLQII